jgi:DNA polymerase-3 subunit gamma/tau
VFILDEVHMLTRGAEAALLKTLEEPPAQVVFVLATTDPQKISETIRSRVQHLQFHLLPVDELEKYVRFVIKEAELTVDDDAINMVLRQGAGSARDTLSALELVVSGGGEPEEAIHTEDIVRAIIERDHAAALAAVARAMQQGRDPHTFAEDVVRTMRDCFLSLMSPELVQLPAARIAELNTYARDMGVQRIVRVMETLGTTMVEMRHAPDARLLLEVAVVQLSSPVLDNSTENLLARVGQLEEAVKVLREKGIAAAAPQAPLNPATGRAKIGGHATGGTERPAQAAPQAPDAPAPAEPVAAAEAANTSENPASAVDNAPAVDDTPASGSGVDPAQAWPQITDAMRGIAKAIFKPAVIESVEGKKIVIRLPNNTPVKRAQEQVATVVAAIKQVCGTTYAVTLVQADPTSPAGMKRPVVAEVDETEQKTIDIVVAEDPYAEIDLSETIAIDNSVDPMLEALTSSFPEGVIMDETPAAEAPPAPKSPKSPRGRK